MEICQIADVQVTNNRVVMKPIFCQTILTCLIPEKHIQWTKEEGRGKVIITRWLNEHQVLCYFIRVSLRQPATTNWHDVAETVAREPKEILHWLEGILEQCRIVMRLESPGLIANTLNDLSAQLRQILPTLNAEYLKVSKARQ